ncbi:MAG: hypothetical protein ACR2NO_06665 [Chloroflexota bacterium]
MADRPKGALREEQRRRGVAELNGVPPVLLKLRFAANRADEQMNIGACIEQVLWFQPSKANMPAQIADE